MDFLFVFKKVVAAGLTPVALVIEMVLIGLLLVAYSRRLSTENPSERLLWWKVKSGDFGTGLIGVAVVFLYLCSIEMIAYPLSGLLENQYPPLEEVEQKPDYIVVLPGGHRHWGLKPDDSEIQRKTLVRLTRGVSYWREFPEATLVFSGLPAEVNPMTNLAIDLGVPREMIFGETESRDTKDHAKFLKETLEGKPFLLVTSGNHMPRSVALFRGQGLDPIPAACDLHYAPIKPFNFSKLTPKARNLGITNDAFHELLGIAWASLRKQSGSEPVVNAAIVEL